MSEALPGIGVFGTDQATKLIVPFFRKAGFRVEAIWGRTPETAAAVANQLEIPFHTNHIDDVLLRKDVDLIVILCPPSHHSQIAVKALGIGKHVAVQSPSGLSQNETLRMVQAAQYYPSLNSVILHGMRFLPTFVNMRKAIANGLIGDVSLCDVRINAGSLVGNSFSWACDDVMGGGILSLFGSQIIDLISYLTGGSRAVRVMGSVKTLKRSTDKINGIRQINSDDLASFQLEMSDGLFATVTLNSRLSGFHQEVVVCGSAGFLIARNGDLFSQKPDQTKEQVLYLDLEDLPPGSQLTPSLPPIYLKGLGRMFRYLSQSFQNCNEEDLKAEFGVPASFEDALYVQAVIEAVKRSSRDRNWTKVIVMEDKEMENSLT